MRTVFMDVNHKLTPPELIGVSQTLAHSIREKEDLESKLAVIKAEYKGKVSAVEEQIKNHSQTIMTGSEQRNVECELVMHWGRNTVSYRRLDNDEIVKERAMTAEERQMELDFEEDDVSEVMSLSECLAEMAKENDKIIKAHFPNGLKVIEGGAQEESPVPVQEKKRKVSKG